MNRESDSMVLLAKEACPVIEVPWGTAALGDLQKSPPLFTSRGIERSG